MIKILIFGTGINMQKISKVINYNKVEIIALIDNNNLKWGRKINNIKVISPHKIKQYNYDFIIIASIDYINITKQLTSLNIEDKKIVQFYNYSLFFPNLFFYNDFIIEDDTLNEIFDNVYLPRLYNC